MRSRSLVMLTLSTVLCAEDVPSFAKDIAPIFSARCVECHGDKKAKAGLRLDSLEAALKGSVDEKVVIPGKSAKSELFELISRKPGEDDIMPPKGKPLTADQIAIIKRWIDAGAK